MKNLHSLDYLEVVAREQSIRKAAQNLAITATALNRRILALEDEIGTPIFERLPSGVRLNAAGELFLHHIRNQSNDLTRVLLQIADMSGLRRGHIRLSACTEAQSGLLPSAIAQYRQQHNGVTFSIQHDSTEQAIEKLETFHADIAFSFETLPPTRCNLVASIPQTIFAIVHCTHPLAQKNNIRLHECRAYPIIAPEDGTLRSTIDLGFMKQHLNFTPALTCDDAASTYAYIHHEQALGFHFALSRPNMPNIVSIAIDAKDLPIAQIKIYKNKGRILPVTAAKFLDQMIEYLDTESM